MIKDKIDKIVKINKTEFFFFLFSIFVRKKYCTCEEFRLSFFMEYDLLETFQQYFTIFGKCLSVWDRIFVAALPQYLTISHNFIKFYI